MIPFRGKPGGSLAVELSDPLPYTDQIMRRGELLNNHVEICEGRPNACHMNTAALWAVKAGVRIVTGYALTDDGMWRPHTWGMRARNIIETTFERTPYFGVQLTADESQMFALRELDHLSACEFLIEARKINPLETQLHPIQLDDNHSDGHSVCCGVTVDPITDHTLDRDD